MKNVNTQLRAPYTSLAFYTRPQVFRASGLSRFGAVLTGVSLALTLGSSLALAQTFYAGPPAGFNPLTASALELELYGFPPAPDKTATAEYAVWAAMVAKDKTRIADTTTTQTTKFRHNLPMGVVRTGGSTGTSHNWSGYAVTAANNTFTATNGYVYGQWVVPAVGAENCSDAPLRAVQWVGFDGWGSNDVLQAGTEIDACAASYSAWFEWWTNGCDPATSTAALPCLQQYLPLTVSPGDLIGVEVWYTTAAPHGHAYVLNVTTGQSQSVSFNQPTGASGSGYQGNSVEWIVERPGYDCTVSSGCLLTDLANYGGVAMNEAHALGTTGFFYPSSSPSGSTILDLTMICPTWNPSSACPSTTAISAASLYGSWALWFYPSGPAL